MEDRTNLNFKKKWIQWVLDFAQMNLKSLPLSRKKALKEEVSYFCSEKPLEQKSEEFEDTWEQFKHSLSLLTPAEYEAVTEINDKGKLINLSKIQESTLDFLKDIHESQYPIPLPEISSFIASPSKGFLEIYRHPKSHSLEDWLKVNFVGLIEQFRPYYPIKKCRGCSRLFLHLTKIEKVYCTSSCAARSIQREKRKIIYENPKEHRAFLKEWRKYQRDRYEKRMKAKHGPNIQVGRKRTRKEG